ncbi:helix-turn-helix domain-containing protein [uncultured Cohaesibacter sp.]|uniref:helix-turn-helix domain-containing protein n=1 Tax=uncultured Cohaesibacter sp. TaxID=1002546 RepID=UPI0029C74C4F|nr:helix-turn-helix domain-containing protein [uncultured Cohaesibacter sp.]
MPAIPLPFIATAVLLLILFLLVKRGCREIWFILFLAGSALQTTIVGLRWETGLEWVRVIQPILAAFLPIVAFAAFRSLDDKRLSVLHGLWPVFVIAAIWLAPVGIDFILSAEFLLYGWLIYSSKPSDGILANTRLGSEKTIAQTRTGVSIALALSGVSDILVSIALSTGEQAIAPPVIAGTISIVLVVIASSLLARTGLERPLSNSTTVDETASRAMIGEADDEDVADEANASEVLGAIEALLQDGLYKDPDLTLARLARRARIPARAVSRTVNQYYGCTITDLVNRYRVEEAMRLLRDTDAPVTQIMFEAGFQTKSNFNRVFKAFAGQTPTSYRTAGS